MYFYYKYLSFCRAAPRFGLSLSICIYGSFSLSLYTHIYTFLYTHIYRQNTLHARLLITKVFLSRCAQVRINKAIYLYVYIDLSLSIYIYIHTYICTHIHSQEATREAAHYEGLSVTLRPG